MTHQQFISVWDAIEDTSQKAEMMRIRSALMMALNQYITRQGLTPTQAAQLFTITPLQMSDFLCGKINLFTVDALLNMAAAAGLHIDIQIRAAA